ncbi:MAG: hypothetical protein IJ797_08825, partial [Selenomonadaceae bacterium]|nr:hypothetical protein [Selenomonadaceae bacterium]
ATTLIGSDNNDTLYSYTGEFKNNSNTFMSGGGSDTVMSFDYGSSETNDYVIIDHFIDASIQGDDLVIEGGNSYINLKNGKNNIFHAHACERDWMAEYGDNLQYEKKVDWYMATDDNNKKLTVSDSSLSAVNIYMNNWDGSDDTWYNNINEVDASSYSGTLKLAGKNFENETLIGGAGDNSLWGGSGGDDIMVGGNGHNTFYFGIDNGNDTIKGVGNGDIVDLMGINLDDIDIEGTTNSAQGLSISVQLKNGNSIMVSGPTGINQVGFKVEGNTWSLNTDKTWIKK